MANTELLTHTDVMALDGLRTNKHAVELLTWGIQSIVGGLLGQNGDIGTLNVQVFPDVSDGQAVLRINVTVNKLPEDV